MAETQIEWTDSTWNPVAGYLIVTVGCTNCYAMEITKRLEAMGVENIGWADAENWSTHGLERHRARGYGRKFLSILMSDLFSKQVSDTFIAEVWQVMRETLHHN